MHTQFYKTWENAQKNYIHVTNKQNTTNNQSNIKTVQRTNKTSKGFA